MNHRERILAAFNHEPVDRVPTDMWATVEVQERLFDHIGLSPEIGRAPDPAGVTQGFGMCGGGLSRGPEAILALWDALDIDGIMVLAPPYIGPPLEMDGDISFDAWGMGYRPQEYATGVYLYHLEAESFVETRRMLLLR